MNRGSVVGHLGDTPKQWDSLEIRDGCGPPLRAFIALASKLEIRRAGGMSCTRIERVPAELMELNSLYHTGIREERNKKIHTKNACGTRVPAACVLRKLLDGLQNAPEDPRPEPESNGFLLRMLGESREDCRCGPPLWVFVSPTLNLDKSKELTRIERKNKSTTARQQDPSPNRTGAHLDISKEETHARSAGAAHRYRPSFYLELHTDKLKKFEVDC
ncbi:hypothetical protein C8R47DRAFT_1070561 [Mycena vitilis]|nr:hypothetical protein C8R47DRAFT_1070561 [Mycena vitilis]